MPCDRQDNFLIEYFILNFLLKKIFGKRYSTWKGNFGPVFFGRGTGCIFIKYIFGITLSHNEEVSDYIILMRV